MSITPTSSSSTTHPPILSQVGSTSESMLSAAQAMTSSLASTSAVSSASQFSAETLLAMLERPSCTSLFQPVEVIPETQNYSRDFEAIIANEDPTVTSRPFVRLCDPAAVTLPLHPHLWNRPVLMKHRFVLELNTFHRFLVILQAHLFFHHSSYQPLIQHHNHHPHLYI